ncbi:SAV_2336 N-terminal domain-related protein [Streptomyces luteolifulvus]|uniref:SAV_2336 N-terminal domain-related protein n=1 Tax=Streptomyces luteolifulvus TaxID=2615112 RepID=UPI00177FA7E7|nr:SAV_2336 N-terminal domain-related protein [Streptomyces luteolifulvus]
MPSDRSGPPEPLARLADVLAEAASGVRPTPLELAELLWLARHMEAPETEPAAQAAAEDGHPCEPGEETPPPPPTEPEPEPRDGRPSPPPETPRAPLHLPSPPGTPGPTDRPHTSLLAPAPPMLRHPLALQRSLRPLKRRIAAPAGHELDERATADRIARLGAAPEWWLPVMRPARERWLRLNLVYDAGPTMPVWRPLIRELHTALAQSGVFRTVTPYRAEPDGTVRGDGAHTPADGRTVTLLISDCMGPQWRRGPAGTLWYGTLRRWAHRMPLAVVQPLPEHLWRTTALPTTPGRLTAPHPAAPSAALTFSPYEPREPQESSESYAAVPLPVLEPGPRWLANWAALLAAPGGTEFPAAVALLDRPSATAASEDRTDVGRLSAEELVLRFRATASPEAFRLAGHLAVGRPDLPVMRLVQAALEPDPHPQHLAEVILSGMLTSAPGPSGSYAFRPGVRDLLLRGLPRSARSRTTELLDRVGGLIDTRAGRAPGEFHASTPASSGTRTGVDGEAFATVAPESVRRLAGPSANGRPALSDRYRLVERLGPTGSLWLADDVERGRRVVVRQHSAPGDREGLRAFLRAAEALTALDHPNVVAVHDHGVEDGAPYVVMEHLDGIPLNSLASPGGYRLPAPLLVSLGRQLARGLGAVHEAGVTHGGLGMSRVLLLPDGTAKLILFDLGKTPGKEGKRDDLRALGQVLFQLSSGVTAQAGTPVTADRLTSLPASLRPAYATAVARLLSHPTEQEEGALILLARSLQRMAEEAYEPLQYTLLGPPSVSRGPGRPLAVGSPEEQAMLCMLLLRHGRTVPRAELTEGIWGRQVPARAAGLLGTYASRLRNALGPGVLAVRPDGHALHTSADFVDAVRFRKLADAAGAGRAAGNAESARAQADEALGLWHGTALDGVPGPAASAARTRLLQLRLSLSATRAELDLELGRFESAADGLTHLVREYPDRDDFRRLLARALEAGPDTSRPTPPQPLRPVVLFEADGLTGRPEARITLEYAVHQILDRAALAPREVQVRDNGYLVLAEPGAYALPVLVAAMRGLSEALAGLDDPPRFRVTFWQTPGDAESPVVPPEVHALGANTAADILVVVSPAWYEEFAGSSAALDPPRFQPLHGNAPDTPPVAWYCPLSGSVSEAEDRDLVRGPFITHDLHELGIPAPGRKAVVHTRPDGPLTLLNPAQPHGTRPPRRTTYYEVDLTTHQAFHTVSLPSHGKGAFAATVELSWHVVDPVTFVRSESTDVAGRLLDHLLDSAGRITRRHPLRRASTAQRTVNAGLRSWPVPGLAISYSVQLAPEGTPPPAPQRAAPAQRRPAPADLLGEADAVLLGFDGPVTRLFSANTAREAALDLLSVVVEYRDPEDALTGRPLPTAGRDAFLHPLEVLRAFAHDRLGPLLRERLDELELRAVPDAPTTHNSIALVRTLHHSGRRVCVVTDVGEPAVHRYLEPYRLPLAGVHGRGADLGLLMPHPDCLERALRSPAAPAPTGVMIGSTVAELTAAQQLGLRFIGLARNHTVEQSLRAAGCEVTVSSLAPLLDAARSL